jgi:hypothetical protein
VRGAKATGRFTTRSAPRDAISKKSARVTQAYSKDLPPKVGAKRGPHRREALQFFSRAICEAKLMSMRRSKMVLAMRVMLQKWCS